MNTRWPSFLLDNLNFDRSTLKQIQFIQWLSNTSYRQHHSEKTNPMKILFKHFSFNMLNTFILLFSKHSLSDRFVRTLLNRHYFCSLVRKRKFHLLYWKFENRFSRLFNPVEIEIIFFQHISTRFSFDNLKMNFFIILYRH